MTNERKREKEQKEREREKERKLHARQEEHPERKSSRVREVAHKKNRGGRTYLIYITHEPSVDHGRASRGNMQSGRLQVIAPRTDGNFELQEKTADSEHLRNVTVRSLVQHSEARHAASCLASNWLPVAGSGVEDNNEGMTTLMLKVNRRKVVLTSVYFPHTVSADQHVEKMYTCIENVHQMLQEHNNNCKRFSR